MFNKGSHKQYSKFSNLSESTLLHRGMHKCLIKIAFSIICAPSCTLDKLSVVRRVQRSLKGNSDDPNFHCCLICWHIFTHLVTVLLWILTLLQIHINNNLLDLMIIHLECSVIYLGINSVKFASVTFIVSFSAVSFDSGTYLLRLNITGVL